MNTPCILSLLLLASSVQADVLVVDSSGGPGWDFTDLPPAVAAAAEGDILLVREGTYQGFTLDKGLTITAEEGDVVELVASIVVEGLPSGSTATLVGLRPIPQPGLLGLDEMRLELRSNAGSVFVRDSEFRSLNAQLPAVSVQPGNVLSLMDCGVQGSINALTPSASLRVEGSAAYLHRSAVFGSLGKNMPQAVIGGGGSSPGGPGGEGVEVINSRLQIDNCLIRGGKGGRGSNTPCSNGGDGGAGVLVTGTSSRVVSRDSGVQGGAGGTTQGLACMNGALGLPYDVVAGAVTQLAGSARILELNSPLREGDALDMTLTGRDGDQASLALSFVTAPVFVPGAQLLLTPGAPLKLFFLGQLPAASPTSVTAPFVPAVLDGFVVHAQALFVDILGQVHSSNGHEITLLSDVF